MDFGVYVAARRGRLVESAVALGLDQPVAEEVVDRVLGDQRRTIERAEDPHPGVLDAVRRVVTGRRPAPVVGPPHRRLVAMAAAVVLVAVTWSPFDAEVTRPVPSLFGLDAPEARSVLAADGFLVVEQPTRACEPKGLVVGSEPAAGADAAYRDVVEIRIAYPSDPFCMARYADRSSAWSFLDFAAGRGPAPEFAASVALIVGGGDTRTLSTEEAEVRASWGSALTALTEAGRTPGARLDVSLTTPDFATCGVSRPRQIGERVALQVSVEVPGRPCPVSAHLYRDDGRIDTVVLYGAP